MQPAIRERATGRRGRRPLRRDKREYAGTRRCADAGRRGRRLLRSKALPRGTWERQRYENGKRFVVRRSAYILVFAGYRAAFYDAVGRAGSLETCGFKQRFWSLLGLRPKVTRARGRGTLSAGGMEKKSNRPPRAKGCRAGARNIPLEKKRTGRRGRRPLRVCGRTVQ